MAAFEKLILCVCTASGEESTNAVQTPCHDSFGSCHDSDGIAEVAVDTTSSPQTPLDSVSTGSRGGSANTRD